MVKPKCICCEYREKNTCTLIHYENGKPYVIGSASAFDGKYGNRLAIKSSPRWCPKRLDKREDEENEMQ